jgi:hypothetical protein
MTPPRTKAAIEQEVVHDRPWPTMLASPHSGSLAAGTSSTGCPIAIVFRDDLAVAVTAGPM